MPTTEISPLLSQRLKLIILDYQETEINESSHDHLDQVNYYLNPVRRNDLQYVAQFQFEILIALKHHEKHINEINRLQYPKSTYTKIRKALNNMHVGFNTN